MSLLQLLYLPLQSEAISTGERKCTVYLCAFSLLCSLPSWKRCKTGRLKHLHEEKDLKIVFSIFWMHFLQKGGWKFLVADSLRLSPGSYLLRTLVSPFRNTEFLLLAVERVETLNVLPSLCLWDKVPWLTTVWTHIPSYGAYETKYKFRLEIKSMCLTNRTI